MKNRRLSWVVVATALLALAGCAESADPSARAAKARIFSPEEPSQDIQKAKERLPLAEVPQNPKLRQRLLGMDRLEAVRRLGGHRVHTTIRFRWEAKDSSLALEEKYELSVDRTGQFHSVHTNNADAGLEVLFAEGKAFAKGRYGPFRPRRLDRAQEGEWRNRAAPAGTALLSLLGEQLLAQGGETVDQDGRKGRRFKLDLGRVEVSEAKDNLPPPEYGQWKDPSTGQLAPGPDPDTLRRLHFEKERKVEGVRGAFVVDESTGVLLALQATVKMSVPAAAGAPAAKLVVDINQSTFANPALKIEPPKEGQVEALRLPHAPKNPLSFMDEKPAPAKAPAAAEPADDADDDRKGGE